MLQNIKNKINKKVKQAREKGLLWVLYKFFRDHIYSHKIHVFLVRELIRPHRVYSRRRNWSFRMLQRKEDLRDFRTHYAHKIPLFEDLFDQGGVPGGVYYDDILVGYTWYFLDRYMDPFFEIFISPRENEIYQTEGYLLPKFRGTPIVLEGEKFALSYFNDLGYVRTSCHVDTENIPILKLHFKLGFEEAGAVLHMRKLLFFRWVTTETYEGTRYERFGRKRPAAASVARSD